MSAQLLGWAATFIACALAGVVFMTSAPLAAMIGLGELHLVPRLGVTIIALGLFDMLLTRLLTRLHPHP